jgi:hypothetical protein
MERLAMAFLALAWAGCSGDKNGESTAKDDSQTKVPDDSDSKTGGDGCVSPGSSRCDNPGSILRGYVAKDPDSTVTGWSGNLWVFLTHNWPDEGELGGVVKSSVVYKDVDLEDGQPFPFEIDMCDGSFGSQWSEDACDYNLDFLLDKNLNATPENILPDELEPSHRVENVVISCEGDSQCLGTILLDCKRGSPCFTFTSADVKLCDCAAESCNSDYPRCQ